MVHSRARAAVDADTGGEGLETLPPADHGLPERYRVLRRLGHGSTNGALLLSAVDARDGELAVIKRGSDRDSLRREAEILAALDHPNIVRLKERHETPRAAFLALEFVDGAEDLGAFLARSGGRLDEATLRPLLLALADAVEAIHAKGFLHRDLKPANILIRPDGSPVIVDFGAAAPLDRASATAQAAAWSDLTDGYAAPEQHLSDQPEGPWTDVYALGAIAYRALTAQVPPAAPARLRGEALVPAARAGDGEAEVFRRAIDRALELEPAARPRTVGDWKRALVAAPARDAELPAPLPPGGAAAADAAEGESLDDYPPTIRVKRVPSHRVTQPAGAQDDAAPQRHRRRPVAALLAVGVLLMAGLAVAGWYGRPLYERHLKTEWIVDAAGGGDTATIGAALARAGDGATIRIRPGTYAESLVLDRPLHLTAAASAAGEAPLIAPEAGPCLLATGTGGSVSGLQLRAPAPAADATDPPAPCLDIASGRLHVERNTISSGAAAGPVILVHNGAEPTILANTIEDSAGAGIVVAEGAGGTIAQNTISDVAGSGLIVRSGADPSVTDNAIANSGGAVFAEGAKGTFARNRIVASQGSAIQVTTGADPLVADNTVENPGEAGIFVYDLGKGRFEGNAITGTGLSGVVIAGGGAPHLVENTIQGSAEHGVLVIDQSGGVLERNRITDNKGHGIALGWDAEVELTDNRLDGNTEPQLLDARER